MSITIPSLQTIVSPAGLDRAVAEISTHLITYDLIDRSFGLSHKIIRKKGVEGTTEEAVPVAYESDGVNHFTLFPNEDFGNFIFFDRTGSDEIINYKARRTAQYSTEIGLIFWGNLKTIYALDWDQRTREHVKTDLVNILKLGRFRFSSIEVLNITYTGSDIYPNYGVTELESQFLMRPFVGMRINLNLVYNNESIC